MSSGKRKREGDAPNIGRPSKRPKIVESGAMPQPSDLDFSFKKSDWEPQRKTKGHTWARIKKIYQIENYDQLPPSTPTHATISVPPSTIPSKKYCDILGYEARYTQNSSGIRYCNSKAYQWILHNLTTFESQQAVLDVRGAGRFIK